MLYLYQAKSLSEEAWKGFVLTMKEHGLKLVLWDAEDLERGLAALLDEAAERAQSAESLQQPEGPPEGEPFLVLEFPKEEIDPIVKSFRENGCPIPLKAMVTDRNKHMLLKDLIIEVSEEHALMGQLMTLQKLMKASEEFPEEAYTQDAWTNFKAIRREAEALMGDLGKREIPLAEAREVLARFNQGVFDLMQEGKA